MQKFNNLYAKVKRNDMGTQGYFNKGDIVKVIAVKARDMAHVTDGYREELIPVEELVCITS